MPPRLQHDARAGADQLPIIQRTPFDVVNVNALLLLGATACDANIAPSRPDDDGTFRAAKEAPRPAPDGDSASSTGL